MKKIIFLIIILTIGIGVGIWYYQRQKAKIDICRDVCFTPTVDQTTKECIDNCLKLPEIKPH